MQLGFFGLQLRLKLICPCDQVKWVAAYAGDQQDYCYSFIWVIIFTRI